MSDGQVETPEAAEPENPADNSIDAILAREEAAQEEAHGGGEGNGGTITPAVTAASYAEALRAARAQSQEQ